MLVCHHSYNSQGGCSDHEDLTIEPVFLTFFGKTGTNDGVWVLYLMCKSEMFREEMKYVRERGGKGTRPLSPFFMRKW